MSYQHDRDLFIERMTREGLPFRITERLLREATGIERRAELACSSEAADRDRVPCPAAATRTIRLKGEAREIPRKPTGPCLCDDYPGGLHAAGKHADVTRITVQDWNAETRIRAILPAGWDFKTEGDPRGYTLKVIPPSYADRNAGCDRHNLDSIGVPPRPSRLRF